MSSVVSAVLAKGFTHIFFRNAINIGLRVLMVDTSDIQEGARLRVDLDTGLVQNLTREQNLTAQSMPRFVQSILEAGGIENYLKTHDGFEV